VRKEVPWEGERYKSSWKKMVVQGRIKITRTGKRDFGETEESKGTLKPEKTVRKDRRSGLKKVFFWA